MQTYTTITPKFQVHIPVAIRKQIGLKKHGRALVRTEKKKIIIEPIRSNFTLWGGTFKVKKPILVEKIGDLIDPSFGKR